MVKLMIRTNQPERASIRIGIAPVTSDPGRINEKSVPVNDCIAGILLSAELRITATMAITPFQFAPANGMHTIARRTILRNAIKRIILSGFIA